MRTFPLSTNGMLHTVTLILLWPLYSSWSWKNIVVIVSSASFLAKSSESSRGFNVAKFCLQKYRHGTPAVFKSSSKVSFFSPANLLVLKSDITKDVVFSAPLPLQYLVLVGSCLFRSIGHICPPYPSHSPLLFFFGGGQGAGVTGCLGVLWPWKKSFQLVSMIEKAILASERGGGGSRSFIPKRSSCEFDSSIVAWGN